MHKYKEGQLVIYTGGRGPHFVFSGLIGRKGYISKLTWSSRKEPMYKVLLNKDEAHLLYPATLPFLPKKHVYHFVFEENIEPYNPKPSWEV